MKKAILIQLGVWCMFFALLATTWNIKNYTDHKKMTRIKKLQTGNLVIYSDSKTCNLSKNTSIAEVIVNDTIAKEVIVKIKPNIKLPYYEEQIIKYEAIK